MKKIGKPLGKLQRRNIETLAAMVAFLFLCVWISIIRVQKIQLVDTDNESRILLNQYAEKIEHGDYVACEYPYLVITTDGEVIHQNDFKILNSKVNVEEMLTMDESFLNNYGNYHKVIFTIKQGEKVTGFSIFLISLENKGHQISWEVIKAFLPLILGLLIMLLLFLHQMWFSNRRVLRPIMEISASAKAIINGDYEKEVLRVYDTKVSANEVGQLIYSFELMRDELKAKQLKEEQLKKSQQELISCISHDLKTPISTIKAYSEGLRDGIARTDQDRKDYVQIIIEKTDLLTMMITELLEYSNAQLQQLDIKREEMYLDDYLNPILKELEGFVTHNEMRLETMIMEENPIVTIDPKRITEVFYNLIENSIKYKQSEDPWVQIKISRREKDVLIRVIDNGIGINASDIPYVFDKFYRAEKSRSSNIPGSGLGLSICKYIVEQHNGSIYCKNLAPNGCEFGFTIN